MKLLSGGYTMVACSRFWIAAAISFAGLFRAAEHCRIVSSPVRRAVQSAGAVGKAALTAASARESSCCADAGAAVNTRARIAIVTRMLRFPSALQARDGDLATLGLFHQKRDQRDARIRPK